MLRFSAIRDRSPVGGAPPGRVFLAACFTAALIAPAAAAAEPVPPPPSHSGTPAGAHSPLSEALRTFVRDGRYLLTFPRRANAKGAWLTAGVVAAAGLAMNRDEEIRGQVLHADRGGPGRIATKFEPLGRTEVEAAALGALYLAGRGARNTRLAEAGATAFEAYLWSALVTGIAKEAFGRERPGRGSGEGRFFAGDTIFPSGHTARSFAIAAVFSERYGRRAGLVAWPLAALIGLSTIEQDLHWTSDVVAGAGLGLAIGRGIAARHSAAGSSSPAPRAAWRIAPRPGGGALIHIVF